MRTLTVVYKLYSDSEKGSTFFVVPNELSRGTPSVGEVLPQLKMKCYRDPTTPTPDSTPRHALQDLHWSSVCDCSVVYCKVPCEPVYEPVDTGRR